MCEIAGLKFTPTSALLMFFVIGSCSDVKDSLEQVEDFFFESDYKEPPGEPIEGFMAFPKWNFYKYLITREGKFYKYFTSFTKPSSKKFIKAIEDIL